MARLLLNATDDGSQCGGRHNHKTAAANEHQYIDSLSRPQFDIVKVTAMRVFRITLPYLLLAISLVGCTSMGSSSSRTPFARVDGDFPDTRIANVVIQEGIVTRGKGNAGGALESLRAKLGKKSDQNSEEAIVAPLRDALAEIDVRAVLARELDTYGRKGLPFPITEVESRSEPISDLATRLQTLEEGGLLILNTEYFFSPDYSALRVETTASLLAKEAAAEPRTKKTKKAKEGRDNNKPVYGNEIIVHWEVPSESRQDPLSYWLTDAGKNIQSALREALRESARLLVWDLNDPDGARNGKTKPQSFTIVDPDGEGTTRIKGVLVMETVKRYIVRLKGGQLLSMPNPKPEPTGGRRPKA